MFAKMMLAAALLLSTGAALASDASYDQQQIREGKVTLAEGGLAKSNAQAEAAKSAQAPKTETRLACKCCQHA
jgi:hypothetical protein